MNKYINNLKGLDILRFILSFSVIIWHYQHFFYPFIPEEQRSVYLEKQPFFHSFQIFYLYGNYAVQFFWLVSGIIFYKIYSFKISEGKISFQTFFVKRFTRLYPLHFVTLIIVLLLQQVSLKVLGNYFVYPVNSIRYFFLNLIFVQSWGTTKFSFNGPTWSVSIEILAYLTFFVVAFSKLIRNYAGLIGTIVFFGIIKKWQLVFSTTDMGDCIYFFFLGCLFIKTFELIRGNRRKQLVALTSLLAVWCICTYNNGRPENIFHILTGFLDFYIVSTAMIVVFVFLVFFNLKIFDQAGTAIFSALGNMTYSTYLIHFPIQLVIMLVLKPANYDIFLTSSFFIFYFFITMFLGYLVYHFFEHPVQLWLRKISRSGE